MFQVVILYILVKFRKSISKLILNLSYWIDREINECITVGIYVDVLLNNSGSYIDD